MSAVCDLWRLNRDKAVATNAKYYGRPPRAFQYLEDVLAGEYRRRRSPHYQLVEEKGTHEDNPDIDKQRKSKYVLLPGETQLPPMGIDDRTVEHMANWFECMRSRQQPHCTVQDGLAHSVANMMAAESYWSGKKQFWDPATETFSDRRPA